MTVQAKGSRSRRKVLVLAGPTASGKSARALQHAREGKGNGVIINADSLQIYDALPLLTARPEAEDMGGVPHLLYAALSPRETCDAALWRDMALREIRAALSADLRPILVGGTGFYLKSLLEGLSPIPDIPDDVRLLGEELMDRVGIEEFFGLLAERDPKTAQRLDPRNRQRILRAWEVLVHTGKPLADWQSIPRLPPAPDLVFDVEILLPERDVLYDRCNRRFLKMMDRGALEEVRNFDDQILKGEVQETAASTHALGFRPLQSHLRGEIDIETAVLLAQNETRHYAKRQVTWFRHQIPSASFVFS